MYPKTGMNVNRLLEMQSALNSALSVLMSEAGQATASSASNVSDA